MDSVTSPGPFPFFRLPAEIRNMIYRLVIVTDRCLFVRDMHREEFKKSQENGSCRFRSTYLAPDHICSLRTSPAPRFLSCLQQYPGLGPTKTTYTLGTPHPSAKMTTSMLSLDKRSREEVASIFYGENTFLFTTMSSLMPFIKDRTGETRKYIQNIWLRLIVEVQNWDAICVEHGKPAIWNTAFSSVLKLSHVNIRRLCIQIFDDTGLDLLCDDVMLRSRSMLWLHKLSRFKDLEMLGLQYALGGLATAAFKETNTANKEQLWRFLAPKMLKKDSDDHSPDALQQRRIWNFSTTHRCNRTQNIHDLTTQGFESDFDDNM